MKKGIFIMLLILLNGCLYYDFEGECFRPIIQTVSSSNCYRNRGKPYPVIAGYQKQNSIGNTNPQQRLNDIRSCGSNESLYDFKVGYEKFRACMSSKGYIYFHPAECGTQNPKWSTGKCNL
ncbi:hypothetical protein [Rodentibacter haemolyticus]|uniref:Lipoprotein n=1 Tax=Rodentibacter haemolyticus TaxID=2778911 RepID=A0ABX6UYM3_9PAST|nr:hypothetical protein [Rodentibacter haemolyticus]QPB43227.1 hypothetical protein IHV77_03735 [Rodentibacter haemolyticus]